MSSLAEQIRKIIEKVTAELVGASLCNRQNFPTCTEIGKKCHEIGYGGSGDVANALKNESYASIYKTLEEAQAFNFQMLDGALVQMMYVVKKKELVSHRLAFFPSPYLEEFQNNPEIYIEDEIYAEVVMKNIVPFPVRFDYDPRLEVAKDVYHPKSHLTLGQYQNCRIPVSAPMLPNQFVGFLLRNFYNTAFRRYSDCVPASCLRLDRTITPNEEKIPHFVCGS